MILQEAKQKDLKDISICHQRAFPDSLTSKLGLGYLIKMYGWYLSNTYTFLYFIREKGTLVGYVGGLLRDENVITGSASGMTQFSFWEALKGMIIRPWLLFHPQILPRYKFILRNLKMKMFGIPYKEKPSDVPTKKQAGLVIIAIDPSCQGKGYGTLLLKEFENLCWHRGFDNLYLSVRKENSKAIKVYQENGWSISTTEGNEYGMNKIIDLSKVV